MSFTTADNKAKEVNWLVLNDIHDRPGSFGELLALNQQHPYEYIFLNGDMFDYQTDEQQLINHLINPCTEQFATTKPFVFIRGNHETRGKYAREIKNYFSNYGQGQYFTYQHGPVYGIALDTGEDKEDNSPVYAGIVNFDDYRKQQADWLQQQLQSDAARKSPFRVVMMHIPPYYSGEGHGTMHCRQLFDPIFNKYKVDLVISGHTHRYGVHPPVKGQHNYPIIIGGGPLAGKRTLMRVNANQSQIKVQMLGDTGLEVGNYVVNKRNRSA
jgi:predicted phosphodiesterase